MYDNAIEICFQELIGKWKLLLKSEYITLKCNIFFVTLLKGNGPLLCCLMEHLAVLCLYLSSITL